MPYFEKINIFFNIIAKKFELIYKDWSKLFVRFGSFEITSIRLYTPLRNPLRKLDYVYNLIEVISSYIILPKGMQRFTLLIL